VRRRVSCSNSLCPAAQPAFECKQPGVFTPRGRSQGCSGCFCFCPRKLLSLQIRAGCPLASVQLRKPGSSAGQTLLPEHPGAGPLAARAVFSLEWLWRGCDAAGEPYALGAPSCVSPSWPWSAGQAALTARPPAGGAAESALLPTVTEGNLNFLS